MKYERAGRLDGVIIGRGMESGKRDRHDDPVLVGIDAVDQDDDYGHEQVEQQQTPALPDLDEEFTEVLLDIEAPDDKGNDKPGHAEGNPDGFREGWNRKNDFRDNFGPGPTA